MLSFHFVIFIYCFFFVCAEAKNGVGTEAELEAKAGGSVVPEQKSKVIRIGFLFNYTNHVGFVRKMQLYILSLSMCTGRKTYKVLYN